jgi:RNA polymerase sigma factor (sigma-70 family)
VSGETAGNEITPRSEASNLNTVPASRKEWSLTQESFDKLLAWLDSDRELAGKRYEEIRLRLIKLFKCRGCLEPEELTDETINRVTKKLPEIIETYVGEPLRYFIGVAHNVHLEYLRKRSETQKIEPPPPAEVQDEIEPEYECLEKCLEQLSERNRELVLQYYQGEKQVKIKRRQVLAERLGTKLTTLRLQAFRIRANLKLCIQDCLRQRI